MARTLWTMVAVNSMGKETAGFSVISNNYMVENWDLSQTIRAIHNKEVINLDFDTSGQIISSNGSIKKYTHFDVQTGEMVSPPAPVILNRIERNNKLVGYTVFTGSGRIRKINVTDAVQLYNTVGIANGKLRHTTYGDIISSINGEYPIMEVDIEKASEGTAVAKVVYIADVIVNKGGVATKMVQYYGIFVNGTSASKISKVMDMVKAGNSELKEKLRRLGAHNIEQSASTIRGGAAQFFTVVPAQTFEDIRRICTVESHIQASGSEKADTMISRLIFNAPGEYREMIAKGGVVDESKLSGEFSEKEIASFKTQVDLLTKRFQ